MDLLKVTVKHRHGESKEMYACTSIVTISYYVYRRVYRKWGEGRTAVTDKRIRGENCY